MPPYGQTAAPSKEEIVEMMNTVLEGYLSPVSQAVLDNGGTFEFEFTIKEFEQTNSGFRMDDLNLSINAKW